MFSRDGRLAISARGSRRACIIIKFVSRGRHRGGIVVTSLAPIRPRAAHLVTQEGDNRGDDRRTHQERRDQYSQVVHLAAVLSSMNTTLAGPASLRGRAVSSPGARTARAR